MWFYQGDVVFETIRIRCRMWIETRSKGTKLIEVSFVKGL
jgi:hypothetical protein